MENNQTIIELYNIYLELDMKCLRRKLNFICITIMSVVVLILLTTLLLILRKTLSLGKFVLMNMTFFSPPTIEDEIDCEFDDPICSLDDKSLCGDSIQNYVVMFNFNACNYYERGRDKNPLYVYMLFKMQTIYYYMHWLPQICCYLFIYIIPMHRKRVRLKIKLFNILWCVLYALISYSV